jgi:hypothetical protein
MPYRVIPGSKQVTDPDGAHFCDAVSPLAAILIAVSLNHRNHRPTIDGDVVLCSRCQSHLPEDADEPCVPKTPRCPETPDLFEAAAPKPKARRKAA